MLLRMRRHPLPEARAYAEMMLTELRKVIPSFLRRIDVADRGGAWSSYLADVRDATERVADELLGHLQPEDVPGVQLIDWDPDAEVKVVAAALYPVTHLPEHQVMAAVRAMSTEDRLRVLQAAVGDRKNRRHKPGRAFERASYRFDILSDYGAFRDLQRHRMLTVEWQDLTPRHGYVRPGSVDDAGQAAAFDEAMHRSAALYDALRERFDTQASYAVSMAYRVRYVMQMNVREAFHLLELRSSPQGHPAYRLVSQQMHRLIADQAGHRALAEAMRFVDYSEPELARLDGERQAEARRYQR
jgi:thymidylate synthase ThyX